VAITRKRPVDNVIMQMEYLRMRLECLRLAMMGARASSEAIPLAKKMYDFVKDGALPVPVAPKRVLKRVPAKPAPRE